MQPSTSGSFKLPRCVNARGSPLRIGCRAILQQHLQKQGAPLMSGSVDPLYWLVVGLLCWQNPLDAPLHIYWEKMPVKQSKQAAGWLHFHSAMPV